MKIERVLELLKIERECVTRQSSCNEKSKLCDRNCGECDIAQNDLELIEMYDFVISMIETLSGRSQKPGHWKGFTQSRYYGKDDYGEPIFRDGRFYICSECRRKSVIKYPYCPRCGAKMDAEVKQNETD